VNAKTIEVGGECSAISDGCSSQPCVPVPAGVRALVVVLDKLDAQEQAKPACGGR
jgi:hypothetical protein